jgi:hypothetical protein
MSATPDRVPEWLLERLAAGELSKAQEHELRQRLRAHDEEHRLAALAGSNTEILQTLPPAKVLAEVERRAAIRGEAPQKRRTHFLLRPRWTLSFATACAAGLLLFFAAREPGEYVGIKGDPKPASLRIYRKGQASPEIVRAGTEVRKGDTLQLRYVAQGKRYGVIASIDGRGTVTLHLPETPGNAATLERDGERALPHAYELDDSPGFERFVFVTSDAPFTTEAVVSALKNHEPPPAPLGMFEISLKKERP